MKQGLLGKVLSGKGLGSSRKEVSGQYPAAADSSTEKEVIDVSDSGGDKIEKSSKSSAAAKKQAQLEAAARAGSARAQSKLSSMRADDGDLLARIEELEHRNKNLEEENSDLRDEVCTKDAQLARLEDRPTLGAWMAKSGKHKSTKDLHALAAQPAPKASPFLEKAFDSLTSMDEAIEKALQSGALALLKVEAIFEMERVERRQDLEESKKATGKTAFLTPKEAVEQFQQRDRSVAFLTYGWRTRDHPDPDNKTLSAVKRALRSEAGRHIRCLFWDYSCLYQWPRSDEQEQMFRKGLEVMAFGYASPLSTSVLRFSWIPDRPKEFNGLVAVFPEEVSLNARHTDAAFSDGDKHEPTKEAKDRVMALMEDGGRTVKSMDWENQRVLPGQTPDVDMGRWRVKFATHEQAKQLVEDLRKLREKDPDAPMAALWYNELTLEQRGWPIFEKAVSEEAVTRAAFYKKLNDLLQDELPGKFINIFGDGEDDVQPVRFTAPEGGAGERINETRTSLRNATFTGKGDHVVVEGLFNSFVVTMSKAMADVAKKIGDDVPDRKWINMKTNKEGNMVNGKKEGNGRLIKADGSVFEGYFHEDKKHGFGRTYFSNGDVFEGNYVNDQRQGDGKMTFFTGDVFEGEYENDRRKPGNGVMTYKNGDKFTGKMKDKFRDGKGVMTYKNGDVYAGQFRDDQLSGRGKFTFASGDEFDGRWEKNEPLSNGTKPFYITARSVEMQGVVVATFKMKVAQSGSKI
jgi:hypothetical protein